MLIINEKDITLLELFQRTGKTVLAIQSACENDRKYLFSIE